MDKLYSFKNITKKPIVILLNGKNIIIKPNEVITGNSYLSNYRGLLKLNKPTNQIPEEENPKLVDLVSEISIYDNEIEEEKSKSVLLEYNIIEKSSVREDNMKKIDLSDVTFTIPLSIDSNDRKRNITIILDYLCKHFKTNIFVCEFDKSIKLKDIWKSEWEENCRLFFIENNNNIFHKTKILNDLAKLSKTPIVVSYDCDVLLPPKAYLEAANEIRNNRVDFCYPFNKPLRHIKEKEALTFQNTLDIETISEKSFVTNEGIPPGGCLFMNRNKFIEIGMENERMISWGPEDQERLERINKLGYRLKSLNYSLFHLDHEIKSNSNEKNSFFSKNVLEYTKVKNMSVKDLRDYIESWKNA